MKGRHGGSALCGRQCMHGNSSYSNGQKSSRALAWLWGASPSAAGPAVGTWSAACRGRHEGAALEVVTGYWPTCLLATPTAHTRSTTHLAPRPLHSPCIGAARLHVQSAELVRCGGGGGGGSKWTCPSAAVARSSPTIGASQLTEQLLSHVPGPVRKSSVGLRQRHVSQGCS